MKEEIVDDIGKLVTYAIETGDIETEEAAMRVEQYLATFQPNHLDEKDMLH